MNVRGIADVDRDRDPRIGQGKRLQLRLAKFGPVLLGCVRFGLDLAEVGQLHEVEGKIALPPLPAPTLDEPAHFSGVRGALETVGLALIPERTADREGNKRMNHGMMKLRWLRIETDGPRHLRRFRQRISRGQSNLRIGGPFLQMRDVLLVAGESLVRSRRGGVQLVAEFCPFGHGRHRFLIDPSLNRCPTPTCMEQADGHAELPGNLPREKITHGSKAAHGLRRTNFPASVQIRTRESGHRARDLEMTDFGKLRRSFFRVIIRRLGNRPFHVRLAGAKPHLADENIGEDQFVGTADRQVLRFVIRGKRVECHPPFAPRIGGGHLLLPGKGHGHGLTRCSRPPDGQRHVALQHHIVAEKAR